MPRRIAQIKMPDGRVREAIIDVSEDSSNTPSWETSGLKNLRPGFPKSDVPEPEPSTLNKIGQSLFESVARPQSAGDLATLAAAAPMMGLRGILKSAPGILRSTVTGTLDKGGQVIEEAGKFVPLRTGKAIERVGSELRTVADNRRPLQTGANALGKNWERAVEGPYQQWERPSAENLPDSNIDPHSPGTGARGVEPIAQPYRANDPHNRVQLANESLKDPNQVRIASQAIQKEPDRLTRQAMIDFLASSWQKTKF